MKHGQFSILLYFLPFLFFMKKSKRINRNLSFIGIIILGVLVYVFGTSVYDGLNTVSP